MKKQPIEERIVFHEIIHAVDNKIKMMASIPFFYVWYEFNKDKFKDCSCEEIISEFKKCLRYK